MFFLLFFGNSRGMWSYLLSPCKKVLMVCLDERKENRKENMNNDVFFVWLKRKIKENEEKD